MYMLYMYVSGMYVCVCVGVIWQRGQVNAVVIPFLGRLSVSDS